MEKQFGGKTIALTGGGTAGHIWPAIEVGKEIKRINPAIRIIYLGLESSQEEELAKLNHFEFFSIQSGKWRRYFSLSNILTPYYIWKGIKQAKKILQEQKVDALFAKGGFVSFPAVLAASGLKIPIIGHESDSIIGKTNVSLLKHMRFLCVAFPRSLYPKKYKEKLVYTGIPLRREFLKAKKIETVFSSKINKPKLLITGGSLGAEFLNNFVFGNLKNLLSVCQIVHLTGDQGIKQAQDLRKKLPFNLKKGYSPLAYSHKMTELIGSADLVLSRAGANTLFELAALRKPALLVPYPYAAQNHQQKNANLVAKIGGAKVVLQDKLANKKILVNLLYFLQHPEIREDMGKKLNGLFVPNSVQKIAELVLEETE